MNTSVVLFRSRLKLSILLFFLFGFYLKAQISGKVVNQDQVPIPSAVVTYGQTATLSDFDGNFTISEPEDFPITLGVSASGYASSEVEVLSPTQELLISLTFGQSLDEVIVSAGRKAEKIQDAPNSVSIISSREIANKPLLNPVLYLESLAGIDIQRQSGNRVNVNLRGPSGVLTSDTYVMLDYRGIIQTGLDVFDQGSTTLNSLDLERVELVRGPVSSLYGPGVSSGVIHFLSKDPFKYPGTEIELSGGNLSTLRTQLRHAGANPGNTFGYKINLGYQQNGEWDLPEDLLDLFGQPATFAKPYSEKNASIRSDLSLYFRPSEDLLITTVGGYTNVQTNLWTDRGPAYQDANDFFIQARAKTDNLFVQFVYNSNVNNPNNKGFLYFTGEEALIDRTQTEIQIQYNNNISSINTSYTLGAERRSGQFKAPVTFGRNDSNDDLIITGAYLQTKTSLSSKLDLVLSGRFDHYGYNRETSISPNAALVFKPNSKHTIRGSFSQTFITPSAIVLYVDFPYVQTPNLDIWLYGARNQIKVENPENPEVQFFTPLIPSQQGYGISYATVAKIFHQQFNAPVAALGGISGWDAVEAGIATFAQSLGINPSLLTDFSTFMEGDDLLNQLNAAGNITNGIGIDRDGNPLKPRESDPARLRKELNFEVGWKGILSDKVQLSLDVFNLTGSDFSQIRTITPLVAYPTIVGDLEGSLGDGAQFSSSLQNHILSYVSGIYNALGVPLTGLPAGAAGPNAIPSAEQVVGLLWNGQGGSSLGIKSLYLNGVEGLKQLIPESGVLGVTVSNKNPLNYPKPLMIDGYNDSGVDKITYTGIDFGGKILLDPISSIYANYSWISQNIWRGKQDLGPQAQESDFFGLHKPQHRLRIGYNRNPISGFNFGLGAHLSSKFESLLDPLYLGEVDARTILNANVGYNSNWISVFLNIDNLFGTRYSLFPGMPEVGTRALVTARLKL